MDFIESYKEYKNNEIVMKVFLAVQLIFVFFYFFALNCFKSLEGHGVLLIITLGIIVLIRASKDSKKCESLKDRKNISVKKLIKHRVKIRSEIKKINRKKIENLYIPMPIMIQFILVILTIYFTEIIYHFNKSNPEINNVEIVYPIIITLGFSVITQVLFTIDALKRSKKLIKNLKNIGELKKEITLEKDDSIIETNDVNKINSLIKKGYKYNENELRKALIE